MENIAKPSDPRQEFKAISVLFMAMIAGVVMFAIVGFGLVFVRSVESPVAGSAQKVLIGAAALAAILILVAHSLYRRKLLPAKQFGATLSEKINHYRSALIIYMALSEFAALIGVIGYMLTGDYMFGFITGAGLLNMILRRPDKSRMSTDLDLDSMERAQLE